jgi:hypothetical protein
MLLLYSLLVSIVHATETICPGYNWGIGTTQIMDTGHGMALVYNTTDCVIDSLVYNITNPCTDSAEISCGNDGTISQYTDDSGDEYACYQSEFSGICNGDEVQVCCRNDGVIPSAYTKPISSSRSPNSASPSSASTIATRDSTKVTTTLVSYIYLNSSSIQSTVDSDGSSPPSSTSVSTTTS